MFDSREIAERALLRAELIIARRNRRHGKLKAAVLMLGAAAMAIYVIALPAGYEGASPPAAQASVSILDGAKVGGYILAGIFGFVLGVIAAMYFPGNARKKDALRKLALLTACCLVIAVSAAIAMSSGMRAGGYILVCAIGFVLGMGVTLACLWKQIKRDR